jgi:hypothetical protein
MAFPMQFLMAFEAPFSGVLAFGFALHLGTIAESQVNAAVVALNASIIIGPEGL